MFNSRAHTAASFCAPRRSIGCAGKKLFLNGRLLCLAVLCLCRFFPSAAAAAETEEGKPELQSVADIGVVEVDEDLFFSITVEQRLQVKGFSLILSGPIRLRVRDQAPGDSGAIRLQDWDEPSDFARIIPKISYTHEFGEGRIDFLAGALNNISIGTGAVLTHYFNTTDMDAYNGGLNLSGSYRGNGLDFLLNNLVSPSVLVGRMYAAPAGWFTEADWAERIYIGGTFGADVNAPMRAYEHTTRILSVAGGEIGAAAVHTERVRLDPVLSLMAMDGDLGVHVSALLRWTVSPSRGLDLSIRGEYRYAGSDYHPGVFNLFYDFNRFHYRLPNSPPNSTLADQQSYGESLRPGHGLAVDLAFHWRSRFEVGASYDREGTARRHWIMFYTAIAPKEGYRLSAFFAGQDITGGAGLFGKNSIFGIEARGRIWRPLDFFLYFTRRWRDIENSTSPADEFGGGFGAGVSY